MPAKIYDSIEDALRAGIVVPGYELPAAIFSTDSNAPALPELASADEATLHTDTNRRTPRRRIKIIAPEFSSFFQQLETNEQEKTAIEKLRKKIKQFGGNPNSHAAPDMMAVITGALDNSERVVSREMLLSYRAEVPAAIQDWVKSTPGISEPGVARLLGALGHPVHAIPKDSVRQTEGEYKGYYQTIPRPDDAAHRTLGQLYAYCGLGAYSAYRHPSEGKDKASQADVFKGGRTWLRTIVYTISLGLRNSRSDPYRGIYDEEKAKGIERGWDKEKSARLSSNRAEQHAMRLVGKKFLADLYDVSKGTCGC